MFKQGTIKQENLISFLGFSAVFFALGIFLYLSKNDNNTLAGICRINYLIPIAIYSIGIVIICYFIFVLLKKKIAKIISFFISVIIGIPLGLYFMNLFFRLFVYIRSWIDILINT